MTEEEGKGQEADIPTREEREELRKKWQAAENSRQALGMKAPMVHEVLPVLLDAIDTLEQQNEQLNGVDLANRAFCEWNRELKEQVVALEQRLAAAETALRENEEQESINWQQKAGHLEMERDAALAKLAAAEARQLQFVTEKINALDGQRKHIDNSWARFLELGPDQEQRVVAMRGELEGARKNQRIIYCGPQEYTVRVVELERELEEARADRDSAWDRAVKAAYDSYENAMAALRERAERAEARTVSENNASQLLCQQLCIKIATLTQERDTLQKQLAASYIP